MPTNFTVVPVNVGAKKVNEEEEEEDVDDNNVLKEAEEDAAGETRLWKHDLAASSSSQSFSWADLASCPWASHGKTPNLP